MKPLTKWELDELADYNRRVTRGIYHDPAYVARMTAMQERFDEVGWDSTPEHYKGWETPCQCIQHRVERWANRIAVITVVVALIWFGGNFIVYLLKGGH